MREIVSRANYQCYIKRSKAQSQQALYEEHLQVIHELLDDLMKVVSKLIRFHRISRAEFMEFP
jgi:hypothetical protein